MAAKPRFRKVTGKPAKLSGASLSGEHVKKRKESAKKGVATKAAGKQKRQAAAQAATAGPSKKPKFAKPTGAKPAKLGGAASARVEKSVKAQKGIPQRGKRGGMYTLGAGGQKVYAGKKR